MMRQMRENTKIIMLVTAAAFVALMVFEWGMDITGQSAGVQELVKLVDEGGTPVSPARDAHNVMEVIFGFLESQRRGNEKISIPVPR